MLVGMGFARWLRGDTVALVDEPREVDSFHQSLQSLVISSALQSQPQSTAKALSVAAIYRARMMNSDTLSSLPIRTVNGTVLPAPNAAQDFQEFVAEIVLAMQDFGDAFVRVDSKGDATVLQNQRMDVEWDASGTKRVYSYDRVRLRTEGVARNLWVVSMNRGAADLRGAGPMQSKRIAGLIAEQEYSQQFFQNNAQHTGALVHPGELTPDESKALYDAWVAGQSERSTGVLSGGLDYKPMSFNPSDSEWTDTHLVGIGDVATLFGIPSTLLNYTPGGSSLTYQNVGSVYEGYWRMTLAPTFARRIERLISAIAAIQVKFDPEELFLATLKERAEATATLVRAGFDPDASRDVAGMPPLTHTGILPVSLEQGEQI